MTAQHWLADAVMYQIYPQSFADSDGDGIGDLPGIRARLDHLSWLGVDTMWINPCFVSPFNDAGYDVADYLAIAPRYGTERDLLDLIAAARERGIRVMLDLVAGHTSDQHPWFVHSAADPADDRYIWADRQAAGFVASPGTREGFYLPNFFDSQPALNFGYARMDPDEPWRLPVDAPGPLANRRALRDVMDYWLSRGVAGFRVDMAHSLVKDDGDRAETGKIWRELRDWLDTAHPEAAIVAEWSDPAVSVPAGFHADFFLHFGGDSDGMPLRSLWNNNAGTRKETWGGPQDCYFDAEAKGTMSTFLDAWRHAREVIGDLGFSALPSSNHDFSRLACGPRTAEQLGAAFTFLLTWQTVPAIYAGDEIGMRYVPGMPVHEGSALGPNHNRAGCRTPVQWDDGPNAGFSTAAPEALYLPVDPDPDRPTVAAQREDEGSVLHLVRRLIALRKAHPELGPAGEVEILSTGYPFAYIRGGRFLVVVNPGRDAVALDVPALARAASPVEVAGITVDGARVQAAGFSYGVFELAP
ncbi:MAG TPA: alpha-amylase family glycosyl hydrolase [Phytomonospora sp.]